VDENYRRSLYADLHGSFPEMFVNPPGAPYEILTDPTEIAAAEADYAEKLASAGLPSFMGGTGVVYADPYGVIVRDAIRLRTGGYSTFRRLVPPGNATGVVILPRLGNDVVLVRHFRHSTRDWRWEIPRGFGAPDSDPAADARRELHEEIGVEASALHDLGVTFPDTGVTGTPVRLFYAEIVDTPVASDPEEGIDDVRTVSSSEFAAMIRDETISDGFTLNAYARAVLRGFLPAQR
jgi:ADP-ribose pyrophosphatase